MKSQIAQKALVALIIVVFVFVVGNLIYNVENLYIGEEIEPTFYQPTQISGSPIASMSTLADAIRYIWFAMLGIMILAIAVSVYYFVKSKEKKKWRNLLVKIVVGLIVAVVVLGFLLTYNGFDVQNSSDGSSILPGGGGSGQGGTDGQNQTSGAPTGMQVLVSFGLVFLAG
jgi:asparagine N-glycosylation enzyme membrane subunit Stt3